MPSGRKFKSFDPQTICDDPAIAIIAKRGSGKSVLIEELCYRFRRMPCGVLICPTDGENSSAKCFFPDLFIHTTVNEEIFLRILNRQGIILSKLKIQKKTKGTAFDPSVLVIMDDCMADKETVKKLCNSSLRVIMLNGRHKKFSYICTLQDITNLSMSIRGQFDYIFLFEEANKKRLKTFYDEYGGGYTRNEFDKIFQEMTRDYGIMVICKRGKEKGICRYKVDKTDRKFSFGSNKFREYHKKFCRNDMDLKRGQLARESQKKLLEDKLKKACKI